MLRCFEGWPRSRGRVYLQRAAPENLEELRRERMRKVIATKGPKLHAAHASGAKSVLVLEDFDFMISNHVLIAEALFAELDGSKYAIDEIYLIDTHLPAEWWVMLLARGQERWPQDDESPPLWTSRQESLTDLMARGPLGDA